MSRLAARLSLGRVPARLSRGRVSVRLSPGRVSALVPVLILALAEAAAPAARAQGVQTADSQVLLAEAKRNFDALDYDRTVAALDRVIAILEARPPQDPGRKDLPEAYEIRGRSRFGLGDQEGARADFVSLLRANPGYLLTGQISPRVVALFGEAQKATVTTLRLTVTPDSADVRIDGAPAAVGASIPIAVGEHVISAKQLGYREATQTLQIEADKPAEATLALERVSAILSVLTAPASVEVIIDGISHGRTAAGPPPAKYADAAAKAGVPLPDVSSPMIVTDIAPGAHRVEFKRDCYVAAERRVVIESPADYAIDPVKLDHAVATLSVRANQPGAQVFVDGQARGMAPYVASDLCEGEHTVEVRTIAGRYFKRVLAHTGDNLEVSGTVKPALALVATMSAGATTINADLRVILERVLEPAQSVTLFAPPLDQVDQAIKAQQLPAGWLAFDGKGRAIGVAADISAPMRQDLSAKLARTFDAQGIASVTAPSALDHNRIVVSLLSAGSGHPDVLEVSLDSPESIRAALGRLDRTLSFFRPSIGLLTIDVADVSGAVVVGVDVNGPAAKAGVQVGDIVTRMNAQEIADVGTLAAQLATHKAGDDLTIEVKPRAGAPKRADLKVSMAPRLIGLSDQTLLANAALLDLRSRLTVASSPVEEAVIRLNLAAAMVQLESWSDARAELQRITLPDGPGVANGTVEYLIGLCAERLGNRGEAEAAWKAAAASESLLTEDGPPVKELAETGLANLQRGAGQPPR